MRHEEHAADVGLLDAGVVESVADGRDCHDIVADLAEKPELQLQLGLDDGANDQQP